MGALQTVIGHCRRSMLGRRESSQPQTAELHLHRPLTAVTSWPAGRLSTATIAAQSLSCVDAETESAASAARACRHGLRRTSTVALSNARARHGSGTTPTVAMPPHRTAGSDSQCQCMLRTSGGVQLLTNNLSPRLIRKAATRPTRAHAAILSAMATQLGAR